MSMMFTSQITICIENSEVSADYCYKSNQVGDKRFIDAHKTLMTSS